MSAEAEFQEAAAGGRANHFPRPGSTAPPAPSSLLRYGRRAGKEAAIFFLERMINRSSLLAVISFFPLALFCSSFAKDGNGEATFSRLGQWVGRALSLGRPGSWYYGARPTSKPGYDARRPSYPGRCISAKRSRSAPGFYFAASVTGKPE